MQWDRERRRTELRKQTQQMLYALATVATAMLVRADRIENIQDAKARLREFLPGQER